MRRVADGTGAQQAPRDADERVPAESELRLRLALSASRQGLYDVDLRSGRTYYTPEYFALLGYPAEARVEPNDQWLGRLHPDDRDRVAAIEAAYSDGRSDHRVEFRMRTADGGWKWLLSLGAVVEEDAQGRPLRILGTVTDIDAQKQAEHRAERLSRIYATLSEANQVIVRTPEESRLYGEMCRVAAEHGGFRLAWIAEADPESPIVRPAAWAGTAESYARDIRISLNAAVPTGRGPTGVALREGRAHVVNDFLADPLTAPWHESARKAGIAASAAIPFRRGNRVAGCLNLYAAEAGYFDEEILRLLTDLAANLGFALDNLDNRRSRDRLLDRVTETAGQLSAVLEASPISVMTLDPGGLVLSWNPAAEQMFGWSAEELVGKPVPVALTLNRALFDSLRQAIQARQAFSDVDLRAQSRGGHALDLSVSGAPIFGPGGAVRGAVLVASNITPRKLAERALMQSESLFRGMFEQAAVGMVQVSPDLQVVRVNRRLAQIVGVPEAQLVGIDIDQAPLVDDPISSRAVLERLAQGRADSVVLERRYVHADGQAVYALLSLAVARDPARQPLFYLGVVEDITDVKRAQQVVARLNSELEERVAARTRELERANRDLESFAYSVSHDLLAPVRAISGFAHILAERNADRLDDESKAHLGRIAGAAGRMGELIDDLLDFARLGRTPVQPRLVSIGKIVAEALADLAPRIAESGAQVSVAPDLPQVVGDGTLLRQVLGNLLGNALTYRRKDVPVEIRVSADAQNGEVVLAVEDNGIGIAPAYHEQIFEPFVRLHGIGEYPGTGIGLAIVRKAASLMNGSVRVESEEGKGATFMIRLPAA